MWLLRVVLVLVVILSIQAWRNDFIIPKDAVDERNNFKEDKLLRFTNNYGDECGHRSGHYFNRVVAGRRADMGEFPWIVSVQTKHLKGFRHICGGAIVSTQWVLSAGHCLADVSATDLSIVAGDQDLFKREGYEQRRAIIRAATMNFDLANFENDISLLKTHKPFDFNSHVSPICLPRANDVFSGHGTIVGWGRVGENEMHSETLQHVAVPFLEKDYCDTQYKKIGYSGYLNRCQLCAGFKQGGKDACQGDSGGPLMCRKDDDRYYICGVVSWGIGCARATFPGMYTKVTCFVDWIQGTISNS